MCEDIHLCWEKATALGVRYYEVDLHRDLWGEWRLAQAWGRRGTRLGQVRVVPCDSRDEGLARIAAILKRRQQRRYDLVVGAGAVVRAPLLSAGTYVGVPARKIG